MGHLFISYSSEDRDFVVNLNANLEKFYDVWVDHADIRGGSEWVQEIEQALKNCEVFLVIVSPNSNGSEWVTKESLWAEKLKKYRVPILIEGEIPFHLINIHYIDFRGDFEGGIKDLLEILNKHRKPEDRSGEELSQLIGAAVLAYLSKDFVKAYNIIGQALVLNPAIAETPQDFWEKLQHIESRSDLATQLMPQIKVYEFTSPSQERYSDGSTVYVWSVELDTHEEVLQQVDYVKYELHPSFKPSTQIARDRSTRFKITRKGWGTFNIPIEIHFIDGTIGFTDHQLQF